MAVSAVAPIGGCVAQLGGRSYPLVLRNGEIERFERQHDIGVFDVFDKLLGNGVAQVRHIRDLIALGLVGGGLSDMEADAIVSELPPSENLKMRGVAQNLLVAAFIPPGEDKKKGPAGSRVKRGPKSTTQDQK